MKKKYPLLSRQHFITHLARNAIISVFFLMTALGAGMAGYHYSEGMSWIDAYVNAAMILSGMGPVDPLTTTVGKLFAGTYALFSGLMFIFILGLMMAPIIHQFFLKLELSDMDK